jgi:DNA-directed RNA polymerase subunit L
MRIRLTQLPIPNMKLDLSFLDEEYWMNVNYASHERNIHPLEKNVEIYINAKNLDENIKSITTNDIEYYIDNERTHHNYSEKYPIVLIKLRPTEVFKCKLKAVLGIGETNVIWSGVSNAYYNIGKNDAVLHIESHGQFSEYELLWKACQYMQFKMDKLEEKIKSKYDSVYSRIPDVSTVELTLDDETYTIGNIITYFLQDYDIVEFAGIGKKNDLVKQITIKVVYKHSLKEPLEPISKSITQCKNIMKYIETKIYDIGKKYINKYSK